MDKLSEKLSGEQIKWEKKTKTSLTLSSSLLDRLRQVAKETGTNVSALTEYLVKRGIEAIEDE